MKIRDSLYIAWFNKHLKCKNNQDIKGAKQYNYNTGIFKIALSKLQLFINVL